MLLQGHLALPAQGSGLSVLSVLSVRGLALAAVGGKQPPTQAGYAASGGSLPPRERSRTNRQNLEKA